MSSPIGCLGLQDAARPELLLKRGVFRIVGIFRLFLRIQVIEVAEELVKAMNRGKMLVAVAEMVFAELAGRNRAL